MRPFSIYSNSFDGNTLGYWRFGERGGQLVDVVNGVALTPQDGVPTPQDDGYRFLGVEYLQSAHIGQLTYTTMTLECWIRAWLTPLDSIGTLVAYTLDGENYLSLRARRSTVPTNSLIQFFGIIAAAAFSARWQGVAADTILASAGYWHTAGVLDANAPSVRLYVNGKKRAEDTTNPNIAPFPAGNCRHYVAKTLGSWIATAILDEVRISKVARYDADFPITRFQDGRRAIVRGPGMQAGLCAGVIG